MSEEEEPGPSMRSKRLWLWLVLLLAFGSTSALVGSIVLVYGTARSSNDSIGSPWIWTSVALWCVGSGAFGISLVARNRFNAIRVAGEVLALVVLPLWGLGLNYTLDPCASCGLGRPLASPDVLGVYALYAAALVAYVIARRRPERLRPWAEGWLLALLGAGAGVCAILPIQWLFAIPLALLIPWVGPPLFAPFIAVWLFSRVLVARLRRRGLELQHATERTLAFTAVTLGLWSVLQRLVFGRWPHAVLTETCQWTLSMLEKTGSCGGQHYLCTVAAHGHPWLVRPERWGMRGGRPILVNRQLAVANAFEDLLHARWPRFGRRCRQLYDRCALPISRHVRHPLLCDAVYLLMKPCELGFGLVLLLLDPGDPEVRIQQMYR